MSEPERRDPVDGEHLLEAVDDVVDPQDGPVRGMRVLSSETFSASDAVGGVRGIIESVAPGHAVRRRVHRDGTDARAGARRRPRRRPSSRSPCGSSSAGSDPGVRGLPRRRDRRAVGVAHRGRQGLLRLRAVGERLVVPRHPADHRDRLAARRSRRRAVLEGRVRSTRADPGPEPSPGVRTARCGRRYALATVAFVALFGLRLAVQLPLYFSSEVTWLGTAKLVMGVPRTALALWVSWLLVRGSAAAREQPRPLPEP